MTDIAFDERLTAVLRAYGETAVRPIDADTIATGAMRVRRSPWSRWAAAPSGRRAVLLLLAALLATVAVGVALTVGGRREAMPTVPPAQLPRASDPIISVVPTPAAPRAFRGVLATSIDLPSGVFGVPVELPDGRVLLAGGRSSAFLDLDAGTVERLPEGPLGGGTIVLQDGRILSAAGRCSTCSTTHVQVFDPRANQLTELDDVPIGLPGFQAGCCELFNPAVALLQDGRVLVAGGVAIIPEARSQRIDSAAIFDPDTDRFELLDARLNTPLSDASATTLADGRVLITGGRSDDGGVNGNPPPEAVHAQLFHPSTSTFTDLGPVPGIRGETVAVRLDDGRVLVAEGGDDFSEVEEGGAAVFDPTTEAFTRLPPFPHRLSAAVALRDGRAFVVSTPRFDAQGNPIQSIGSWVAVYDPATGVIEELSDVRSAISQPVRLADGRVLLVENLDVDPTDDSGGPFRVAVYD